MPLKQYLKAQKEGKKLAYHYSEGLLAKLQEIDPHVFDKRKPGPIKAREGKGD